MRIFLAACVTSPLRDPKVPSASALDYPDGFTYPETSTALHRHNHNPTASLLLRPPLGS